MRLIYTVELPRDHIPEFEDCCVVCGASSPGSELQFWTTGASWTQLLFWVSWMFALGSPYHMKAPACRRCARSVKLSMWLDTFLIAVLAVVFLVALWPWIEPFVPFGMRRLAMGVGGLAFVTLGWLPCRPFLVPKFDVHVTPKQIDYEFTDQSIAFRFFLKNADADRVRIVIPMGSRGAFPLALKGGGGHVDGPAQTMARMMGLPVPGEDSHHSHDDKDPELEDSAVD